MQKGAVKAGGALYLAFSCGPSVVIPGKPSARLTHYSMLNTGQRLLRFSILKETPHGPSGLSSTPCVQEPAQGGGTHILNELPGHHRDQTILLYQGFPFVCFKPVVLALR